MWLIESSGMRTHSCYCSPIHLCIPLSDELPVIITNLLFSCVRHHETFQTHVVCDDMTPDELFSLSSFLKGIKDLSLRATTVNVSRLHGYNNWLAQWFWHLCGMHVYLCTFPASPSRPQYVARVLRLYSNQLNSPGGSELSGQPKVCRTQELSPETQHSGTDKWWFQRYTANKPEILNGFLT